MKWPEKTIGDLVALQRGHDLTETEREEGDVPIIGSAGPNGFHRKARAKGPGVTIGRSGGSIGKVTFVETDYWPHNTCIYVTDFKGNEPRFVAYLLGQIDLAQLNSGAAQPSLNRNFVYGVRIRFPKPKEQRRIAEVLTAYDELMGNNRRRMALLEEAARQLYAEWFVRLRYPGHTRTRRADALPKGWTRLPLGEVVDVNRETLGSSFQGELEYVDISAVTPGRIAETMRYDFADAPSRARRVVRHGDIIWSCVRPNRCSHAVIWNPEPNLIVSTGFAVLTPKALPTSYLYQATTTNAFVRNLENRARGAAYPAVVARDFEESEIVVPPAPLVSAFNDFAEPLLAQLKTLTFQTQKLRTARDLLLPRLMSGEVAV